MLQVCTRLKVYLGTHFVKVSNRYSILPGKSEYHVFLVFTQEIIKNNIHILCIDRNLYEL